MPGPWFHHAFRVRYQETDQMGVVYHANYLNWFELGRTELIRQLGIPYTEIEQSGLLLPVVHAEIDFRKPAKYDDIVSVYTRVKSYTRIRLEMSCQVHRRVEKDMKLVEDHNHMGTDLEPSGELLVSGLTRHVWVNRNFKTVRLDQEFPVLYKLIEKQF